MPLISRKKNLNNLCACVVFTTYNYILDIPRLIVYEITGVIPCGN
jgi:hypothetical protein